MRQEISGLIGDTNETNLMITKLVDLLVNNHHVETTSSKIFNNSSIYVALIHLGKIIAYLPNQIDYSLFEVKNFQTFIASGLLELFEFRHELNFNINFDPDEAEDAKFLNEKRIITLSYLLFITAKLVYYSDKFSEQMVYGNGLKNHLIFLTDECFIRTNYLSTLYNLSGVYNLFDQINLNILNMGIKFKDKKLWIETNCNAILLKASHLNRNNTNSMITYLIVLHTNTHEELEKFSEKDLIKDWLLNIISHCESDFRTKNFNRAKFRLRFYNESIEFESQYVQCCSYLHLSVGFLLNCLTKLCLNDETRKYVFSKLEPVLKEILLNGNFIEVLNSVEFLAKLCLSHEVCSQMNNDKIFCKILTKLIYVIDIKESKECIDSKMKKVYGYMQVMAKKIKLNMTMAISK